MNNIKILMNTGMTEHDAKRHINNGAIIYTVEDYLNNFEEYTYSLDDEDKNTLKEFLTKGKDGSLWDSDLTTYNGIKYYIEYCL